MFLIISYIFQKSPQPLVIIFTCMPVAAAFGPAMIWSSGTGKVFM